MPRADGIVVIRPSATKASSTRRRAGGWSTCSSFRGRASAERAARWNAPPRITSTPSSPVVTSPPSTEPGEGLRRSVHRRLGHHTVEPVGAERHAAATRRRSSSAKSPTGSVECTHGSRAFVRSRAMITAGLARPSERSEPSEVAGVDVDGAEELLAPAPNRSIGADPFGQQRYCHLGRVADVRGDDAVRERPQRMPGGQRLGVGDIEPGPADDPVAQRVDQVVGDHVATASHVDQPGVILHQRQFLGADEPLRLRREGERQHDDVGAGEGIRIPVALEHVVHPIEVADVASHDRQVADPTAPAGARGTPRQPPPRW